MKKFLVSILTALLLTVTSIGQASALTDCVFVTAGTTMTLQSSCTTDSTILVPDGFTLDGVNGRTITGVDPVGGHFVGAVVKNAGSTMHVTNLTVTVTGLANVCDGGDSRLAGIWFQDAGGSVTSSTVYNINQGPSGCQEGNAIQIRSAPFDGSHPSTKNVLVRNNVIYGYQKTGILSNGDVYADVYNNVVTGLGPVNYIAQNGIQLGFGAMGSFHDNVVSGNYYTGTSATSAGILAFDINASDNKIFRNDINDNQRKFNQVEDSACPNMLGGIYSDWALCS